jgi:hypothetical protein
VRDGIWHHGTAANADTTERSAGHSLLTGG